MSPRGRSRMRPSKATSGRRGSAGGSLEQERTSFESEEFAGIEPVNRNTSLIGADSLLDGRSGYHAEDDNRWLIDQPVEDHIYKRGGIGGGGADSPRSFPYSVKQQCWEKAEKLKGRDPDRWRRDPLGNIIFRKLVGCPGCLCHDYDHIVPYSKVRDNGDEYLWRPRKTNICPRSGDVTLSARIRTRRTLKRSRGRER